MNRNLRCDQLLATCRQSSARSRRITASFLFRPIRMKNCQLSRRSVADDRPSLSPTPAMVSADLTSEIVQLRAQLRSYKRIARSLLDHHRHAITQPSHPSSTSAAPSTLWMTTSDIDNFARLLKGGPDAEDSSYKLQDGSWCLRCVSSFYIVASFLPALLPFLRPRSAFTSILLSMLPSDSSSTQTLDLLLQLHPGLPSLLPRRDLPRDCLSETNTITFSVCLYV